MYPILVLWFLLFTTTCQTAIAENITNKEIPTDNYRWMGHDFVFCFVSDDGKLSNLAWAQVAQDLDFRFTIAVNPAYDYYINNISYGQLKELWENGFEISNHSYSHGEYGLPDSCSQPPRGSMAGYFECEGIEPEQAMIDFAREIERDSVASLVQIPLQDVISFAYPRHQHTFAIIDSLIVEGYVGARMGSHWNEEEWSYGDFTTYPANSWDGGLSLFRIPTTETVSGLFGDHSAIPPVHFSYEDFLAAAQPHIDHLREVGGVFVVYTHHLGDDDDSMGDINYGSGGLSPLDLEWIVELVRANNGVVMTFGDMCKYYRARSSVVEVDGDYVWQPLPSPVNDVLVPKTLALRNYPNPFNPRTVLSFSLEQESLVDANIFNQAGQLVTTLSSSVFSAGEHHLVWNGVNQKGNLSPTGLYFLRVEAGGISESHKLLLLK